MANEKQNLINRFTEFKNSNRNREELHRKFAVKQKEGWDIIAGWDNLQRIENLESLVKVITHRPFDNRYIFYEDKLVWRTVRKIINHMVPENIGLIAPRQSKDDWGVFVTNFFITHKAVCAYDINSLFPLYAYYPDKKEENFSVDFRKYIDALYKYSYTPEQILSYIYAILHSPTYRSKYFEFLKTDFPRIPFTSDKKLFEELSALGNELIQVHLLKSDSLKHPEHNYYGKGDNTIEKAEWKSGKLYINKSYYFDNVAKEVYEFYIGGYQVLDKWLKDRKSRQLGLNDVSLFNNIINAISFTIEQMKMVDKKTKEWI